MKDISLPPTKSGKTRWVTGIFSRRARKAAKAAEAAKREAEATDRGDGSDGDGSSSTIEAQTPSKKDVLWSFAVPA